MAASMAADFALSPALRLQQSLFAGQADDHRPRPSDADDLPGDLYCQTHGPAARRPHGITLTPPWLVESMLDQLGADAFDTVIDCGAGTGRFSIAAAQRFPQARVLAVEQHPDMLRLLQERLKRSGLAQRVQVIEGDFRRVAIPRRGRCLFIGNPPYVRHHDIEPLWKAWYQGGMRACGIAASQLAGLHLHFLLRAADLMQAGDALCFVTSAEWLDNGYGSAARALLAGNSALAVQSLWVAEPDEAVFPDALVSCAVVHARSAAGAPGNAVQAGAIGAQALRPVRSVARAEFAASNRWSSWCRPTLAASAQGIELGELFRVTRGQVTGGNRAWVLPADQQSLPAGLAVACVTRAQEIIDGSVQMPGAAKHFKRIVNLPRDLDSLSDEWRQAAERFVEHARALGADQGYIARHRKPWYALDMRSPPAAFVSYMGRRPPVFMPNPWRLTFINIAHGLYPRQPITAATLQRVLAHLNTTTDIFSGRVYGGGMTKFEPSDVSRLRLPPSVLKAEA